MFDHLGIHVVNLEASVRFYTAILAPLGFELCSRDESSAGLGPKGAPSLWLYSSAPTTHLGTHIAFAATERKAVDAFHSKGLAAGGKENGPPGVRADYSPNYYAAFLIDPDGNNVEAVCMR